MPQLQWLNKDKAIRQAKQCPYQVLACQAELCYGDADSDNLLIQGDNLAALKALLPRYAGKVKCIFIDPPYNTGSAFEHYDDNLEHSLWLSMMYPRLELLQQLLAEDGSIWMTLDDTEAHYCKVIMDEIFGRRNFVANVVWQKKSSPSNDSRWISDNHDHILSYAKNKSLWRPNKLERTDPQNSIYKHSDDFDGIDSNKKIYGRGTWFPGDMTVKTISQHCLYEIETPSGRKVKPASGRAWVYSKEKLEEMILDNRITFGKHGNNKPCIKRFLAEVEDSKIVPKSVWLYEEVGENRNARQEVKKFNSRNPFSTPKPEILIQRILHLASDKNDLILDSFLGSGTTAAVAHKMGRQYIGIEIGDHAKTHCYERLKKVVDGEQGGISKAVNWHGGGGFKFYRLGKAIFTAEGMVDPAIDFSTLATFVWYLETNTALPNAKTKQSPLLGVHQDTAFYLLFNGILGDKRVSGGNILSAKLLPQLPPFSGQKVIYGNGCRMSASKLKQANIVFKQIPYQVRGR